MLVFFAGCASNSGMDSGADSGKKSEKKAKKAKDGKKKGGFDSEAFNEAYAAGDYEKCIALLSEKNAGAVLNGLDVAMLEYMKSDYMTSAKDFVQLQQDMQQLTADMSAGKVMEAALIGENSVEYVGNTYERIFAYSMKAVNALKMGETDRAVGVFNEYTGNYTAERNCGAERKCGRRPESRFGYRRIGSNRLECEYRRNDREQARFER